jgi:large subunit ribosomal protein L31
LRPSPPPRFAHCLRVGYNTGFPAGLTGGWHFFPKSKDMKEGIHPAYRDVVFQDMASGFKFVTRSTVNSREKIKMEDGKEYPLFKLDVTSESHPFYTGAQQRIIETGRVEKFRQKFARGGKVAAPVGGEAQAETQADEGSSKA